MECEQLVWPYTMPLGRPLLLVCTFGDKEQFPFGAKLISKEPWRKQTLVSMKQTRMLVLIFTSVGLLTDTQMLMIRIISYA